MPRSSIVLALAAALTACGAPSRPPPADISSVPTGELPAPSPSRYCPGLAAMDPFRPWMSELFPACPPPGFGLLLPICDGPCPSPCAATVEAGGMRPGWGGDQTFTSDARGRLLTATRDGKPSLSCTWTGDALTTCTTTFLDESRTASAVRDAAGRLTALTSGDLTLPITRDAAGRISAIGDTRLVHDAHGLLTEVGNLTITYDTAGRPLTESDAHGSRTYHHDDRGRLLRLQLTPQLQVVLTYDDAGRLITLRTGGPLEDSISYTHFDYDCAD
jgi:YD repeat-containing protein